MTEQAANDPANGRGESQMHTASCVMWVCFAGIAIAAIVLYPYLRPLF